MKKLNLINLTAVLIVLTVLFAFKNGNESTGTQQYEFTQFTVIESIVPNGLGRSRIISTLDKRDYKTFTHVKSDTDRSRNKANREDIRSYNYEETKLLNFFNIGGIRFQNIAANDAVLISKVNTMLSEGWEIVDIVAGVESVGGQDDDQGIFLTRYYFKRLK